MSRESISHPSAPPIATESVFYLMGLGPTSPSDGERQTMISFGDKNEAIAYAADYKPIWKQTPGSLDWLKSPLPRSGR